MGGCPERGERGVLDDRSDRGRCEAVGPPCHAVKIYQFSGRPAGELRAQVCDTSRLIGQVDTNLPVEASGPDHGRVEGVYMVGGGHDEQVAVVPPLFKAGEKLVDYAAVLRAGVIFPTLGD